jgi:hypothetical protein
MKRIKNLLLCILLITSYLKPGQLHSQNETAKAIGGAVAVAGLTALAIELSLDEYKTQLAHNAAEFVMSDTFGSKVLRFDLKILDLSITDRKDLSGVKLNIFGLRYQNGKKIILLQKCSNGWISPTGLNVQNINYYKINVDLWDRMMQLWMNNLNESDTDNLELPTKLPNHEEEISFSTLKNITFDEFGNYDFVFLAKRNRINEPHLIFPLRGTKYYVERINEDFNLALENGRFSLFFNDYSQLVNIKRKELLEITKFLNLESVF